MKLPEDKQERTKVIALIAIGVGATLYVLVQYAVRPIMKSNKKNAKRITEITEILKKADMEVQMIGRDRTANEEALAKIAEVSRNNLLHPQMGINYQIPANEVVAKIEKRVGFSLEDPKIRAGGTLPGPKLPQKSNLMSQMMGINVNLSYAQAVKLLRAIREENPYIAISAISVRAQAASPEEHSFSCLISWPAWSDPKKAEQFKPKPKPEAKPKATATDQEGDAKKKAE